MLVITRKCKESLQIGQDVSVTVLDIRSDQIKLGVEAPPAIKVMRAELLGEVCRRNLSAARLHPGDLQGLPWARKEPNNSRQSKVDFPGPPDVYVEVASPNLEEQCAFYVDRGFELRHRTADQAWLVRSHTWICCRLDPNGAGELRMRISPVPSSTSVSP